MITVYVVVTITADCFKVVKVQGDLGALDRDRVNLDDVMHDLSRLIDTTPQTVLTEVMRLLHVRIATVLPSLGTIELLCEFLCHKLKRTVRNCPCMVCLGVRRDRTESIAPGVVINGYRRWQPRLDNMTKSKIT